MRVSLFALPILRRRILRNRPAAFLVLVRLSVLAGMPFRIPLLVGLRLSVTSFRLVLSLLRLGLIGLFFRRWLLIRLLLLLVLRPLLVLWL